MNLKQGTEEWMRAREKCVVTASGLPNLMGCGYKSRAAYWKEQCLGVRTKPNDYAKSLMDRGTNMEAEARDVMTWVVGRPIKEVGFYEKDGRGASPDGIVLSLSGKPEVCEIKCPQSIHSIEFWNEKWQRYRLQLEMQMRYVGADTGHLFIYHPDEGYKYWVVKTDNALWELCEEEMDRFEDWVSASVEPPRMSAKERQRFLRLVDKRKNGQAGPSVGDKRKRSDGPWD